MPILDDIKYFDWLDEIAENHRITATLWADNCQGMDISRISELRRISRNSRGGITENVGRAWTIEKFMILYNSLVAILGEQRVKAELLKLLKNANSDFEKSLIILLSMSPAQQKSATIVLSSIVGPDRSPDDPDKDP